MLIVARSPLFPPDQTAISNCPTAIAGTASATVSPPAAYDWPTSRLLTPCAPRKIWHVELSAAPVVVEIVACAGYQMVPSPVGPMLAVAVPAADTLLCAWP